MEKKSTLVIIGNARDTREKTPLNNPNFEYWTLGSNLAWMQRNKARVDILFELHDLRVLPSGTIGKLKTLDCKLVMKKDYGFGKNLEVYRIDEAREAFDGYLTSSFALMMAQAILENRFKRIEIYGFNMAHETEYIQQKACAEAFIWRAVGMGIDVHIAEGSTLFKCDYIYSYEQPPVSRSFLKSKISQFEKDEKRYTDANTFNDIQRARCEGARELAKSLLKNGIKISDLEGVIDGG